MVYDLLGRARSSALAGKITRYAIGSVIALATSIVVFALMYVIGRRHTTICSIGAFVAGAVPELGAQPPLGVEGRRARWRSCGRSSPTSSISVVALVASSVGTGFDAEPGQGQHHRPTTGSG